MRQRIEALWKRILLIVGSGRISLTDDSGSVQRMQVKMQGLSVHDFVPRLAEYGYASNPPAGSDALMVKLGGDHSHGVVVATNHQASRLKNLPVGATALYDNAGTKVVLNADGTLSVTAETSVTVNAPTATVNASTACSLVCGASSISITPTSVDIVSASLTINGAPFHGHEHSGVQPGAGNSGGVV